jgi:outer membrane receptor protein involved in Fe transport
MKKRHLPWAMWLIWYVLHISSNYVFNQINFKMRFKGIISAIAMLLTGSVVYAQEIDTTKTIELEEVMVTANKREESIVKVNTSITSLSAKKLEDTRTWGLSGLSALVPNYNYQELGVSFQQIQAIRGIQVFSENPAVSTYIDDVNNIDILANGFAFTDIERIEVLRGPQGTLYGRNEYSGVK